VPSVDLLTPLGLLLALGAVPALAALARSERRARRVRHALAVGEPPARGPVPTAIALVAVPCLLSLAVAQPVLRFSETNRVRTDTEAFYIVDISRSMLAASRPSGATRFERSLAAAKRVHASLGDLRSGVATLTDRVLPHLFPTADEEVFTATVDQALTINSPPPRGFEPVGTLFTALDTLRGTNFFSEGIRHRLVLLFTDGESAPWNAQELRAALAQGPPTEFVVVRVWRRGERVWQGEQPEPGYRSDPRSEANVARLASATEGRTFDEAGVRGVAPAVRDLIGTGPRREEGTELRVHALSRWFVLAALVVLALLLWRRNIA
jgi:hypothetical protein